MVVPKAGFNEVIRLNYRPSAPIGTSGSHGRQDKGDKKLYLSALPLTFGVFLLHNIRLNVMQNHNISGALEGFVLR